MMTPSMPGRPTPEPTDENRRYARPPWLKRHVGNRLARLFRPSLVLQLSVDGRSTGARRSTPVVVLDHGGARYLLSVYGETDWARNLRVAGHGLLSSRAGTERIAVVEVPTADRAPLVAAYAQRFGRMPGVAAALREVPDDANHPTFRIVSDPASDPGQGRSRPQ